ncbi:MAG: TAXI family TRAP transporter solute-binding subunit [Rhodospirillales bacterium]|nr:TAXI family TRAP transporter solute-binding subunit [Rhodospirillales bacterium]
MRKIKTLLAVSAIAAVSFITTQASAQVVGIATGQQGSLGYKTGQAVAKVANLKAKITARAQPMAGTSAYIPMINKGEVEFGFCNAVEAEYALNGTGNWKGKANPNLRIVGTMFPLRTGLMVVADSGVKTIKDLQAKKGALRIASEYKASNIIPYYIAGALANGGMKYEDFKMVPVSSFVKGMLALGDNKVDITLISLGSGAGRKVNAKLRSRGGIKYVSLDNSPAGIAKFKSFLPAADIISLKANPKFPGLQENANIVEIPWVMVTHKDAPADLVYKLTKAIAENKGDLGKSFGAFKRANMKMMAPKNAAPYHPGALKYYKEAGIEIGG